MHEFPAMNGRQVAQARNDLCCNVCGEDRFEQLRKDNTRKSGARNKCNRCAYIAYGKKKSPAVMRGRRQRKRKASLAKSYKIIYDPTDMFPRDNIFHYTDFHYSLRMGAWPEGMIVRYVESNQCYEIRCMELVKIEDRDWRTFRREQIA